MTTNEPRKRISPRDADKALDAIYAKAGTGNDAAERCVNCEAPIVREDGMAVFDPKPMLAAERVRAVSEHQALCDERVKEHGDAVRRATVERILDALYKSGAERWSDIERVVREAAR